MKHALILLCLMVGSARAAEPAAEHPLMPVLKLAYERLAYLDTQIQDYTCDFVKQERIDGRLLQREYASLKLRHERIQDGRLVPLAVYLQFLGPDDIEGREVLYVQGRNNGQLIARRGGPRLSYITMAMDPRGELAMQRSHYPITEIGIKSLIERLIEVGEEDLQYGECDVKYFENVTVDRRPCTVIEVTHPFRRTNFRYHVARIFIDDQLRLPIRYASYTWPDEPDGQPRLVEEYTYLNLRFNVGLADKDFDTHNKDYGFGDHVSR